MHRDRVDKKTHSQRSFKLVMYLGFVANLFCLMMPKSFSSWCLGEKGAFAYMFEKKTKRRPRKDFSSTCEGNTIDVASTALFVLYLHISGSHIFLFFERIVSSSISQN